MAYDLEAITSSFTLLYFCTVLEQTHSPFPVGAYRHFFAIEKIVDFTKDTDREIGLLHLAAILDTQDSNHPAG
jgi:hypothetical protein